MTNLTIEQRCDRLDDFIARDAVIRFKWTDGRERACLLSAYSPEAGKDQSSSACPADALWPWLAAMTPDMDDKVSADYWPVMVRDYAKAVRLIPSLPAGADRRCLARAMIVIMQVAEPFDTSGSCATVKALWSRVLAGDEPLGSEWKAAAYAAGAASAACAACAAYAGVAGAADVARVVYVAGAAYAGVADAARAAAARAAYAAYAAARVAYAGVAYVADAADAATSMRATYAVYVAGAASAATNTITRATLAGIFEEQTK